jgi:hypothetical protein
VSALVEVRGNSSDRNSLSPSSVLAMVRSRRFRPPREGSSSVSPSVRNAPSRRVRTTRSASIPATTTASRSSDRSFPLLRQRRVVSPARSGGDPRGLCVVSADDPSAGVPSRNLAAPRLACLSRRTSAGHSGRTRGPILSRCRSTPSEP